MLKLRASLPSASFGGDKCNFKSTLRDVTSHTGKAVVTAESWRNKIISTKLKYMTAHRKIRKHFILKIHLKHVQGCFVYISIFHEISDGDANGI